MVPSIKAWTIVILTVLGAILLCVAVVVAIRHVVANKNKARLQWVSRYSLSLAFIAI